ncbi:MAG: phosphoglucosamine mutase [Planctomycetota bacterium]
MKVFGTDGIRDVANSGWLTPESLLKMGRIIGLILKPSSRVIIGRDTRISGQMIMNSLSAGILSSGVNITDAGIISTPALSFLTKHNKFNLGIMISASHNPADYNGIKILRETGLKITSKTELLIEKHLLNKAPIKSGDIRPGIINTDKKLLNLYINKLLGKAAGQHFSLKGFKIVVDCANGAVSETAPAVLASFGAKVIAINNRPNGKNINLNCGALYPEKMSKAVIKHQADVGFSFDGDADRVIMADEKGIIRDGDFILAIGARYLSKRRSLKKNTVVGTIMTNSGLNAYLKNLGVSLVRTPVGDKYVLDKMMSGGYVLGGEPSGHVIFSDYSLIGDGLLTALIILKIIRSEKKRLSTLSQYLTKYPQILVNVSVKSKPPIERIKPLMAKATEIESLLGCDGRLSLRYSGTEPLLRIMIEGKDEKQIEMLANELADIVKKNS